MKQQSLALSVTTKLGDTFLDTGAHKVTSELGKKVFDCLCRLKRQEQPGMYMRNNLFKQGMVFEVDLEAVGVRGYPVAKVEPNSSAPIEIYTTRVEVKSDLLQKVSEAMNGGTSEKLRDFGDENGDDEESESDDGE